MTTPESETRIAIQLQPGAPRNQVAGLIGNVLRLKIAAPPVKGKANKELIAYLSRLLNIGKGSVTIVKGHSTRNKLVAINGLSRQDILKRLLPQSNLL